MADNDFLTHQRTTGGQSLRQRAEAFLQAREGDTASAPLADVRTLIHELNVHQTELEMQNEELRRVQVELAESRERYADLYNFAPVGYVTLCKDGVVLEANVTAAAMLGIGPCDLVGKRVTEFVDFHSQDAFHLHRQAVFSSSTKQICELQMRTAGKSPLSVRMESIATASQTRRQCRTALLDVSERRVLEREILEIASDEQRRIGHDLHDGLCQELAGLGMLAEGLADELASQAGAAWENPADAVRLQNVARKVSEGLGQATKHSRDLSHGLVPVDVDAQGLSTALQEHVASINALYVAHCAFECEGAVEVANNFIATNLHRIAQEAVANALKHSQAEHISVVLRRGRGNVFLQVSDDGTGMVASSDHHAGMGLQIMKYRADLIGATLTIDANPGRGTSVTCCYPENDHDRPTAPAGEHEGE